MERPMIGYISVEEQVDADFTRAVRRAFLRRLRDRLRGYPYPDANSFEEAVRTLGARNKMRIGRKVVAVKEVAGSVGRPMDFDGAFLPIRRSLGERWKRVDQAFHLGVELPPVSLYELGGRYFVVDGNHRISVARYQGIEWIEADVTRLYARKPAVRVGPVGAEQIAA
jgi:hypothetical protein